MGKAELKESTSLCRKQTSRGAKEAVVAASGDGQPVPTGRGGLLVRCCWWAQPVSLSRLGTSPGTSTAAGFIAAWDPRFVKGRSGSPDTGTGEDEFPFSAVRLPTPLILRVQMMNFFLLFIFPPASPPTALPQRRQSRTDGALQGSRSAQEDTEPAHSAATWPPLLREALISSGRGSSNDFSIPSGCGGGWMDGWMERS